MSEDGARGIRGALQIMFARDAVEGPIEESINSVLTTEPTSEELASVGLPGLRGRQSMAAMRREVRASPQLALIEAVAQLRNIGGQHPVEDTLNALTRILPGGIYRNPERETTRIAARTRNIIRSWGVCVFRVKLLQEMDVRGGLLDMKLANPGDPLEQFLLREIVSVRVKQFGVERDLVETIFTTTSSDLGGGPDWFFAVAESVALGEWICLELNYGRRLRAYRLLGGFRWIPLQQT